MSQKATPELSILALLHQQECQTLLPAPPHQELVCASTHGCAVLPLPNCKARLQKAALPRVEFIHAFNVKLVSHLCPAHTHWWAEGHSHSHHPWSLLNPLPRCKGCQRSPKATWQELPLRVGLPWLAQTLSSLWPGAAAFSTKRPPTHTGKSLALRQGVTGAHQCWGTLLEMKMGEVNSQAPGSLEEN